MQYDPFHKWIPLIAVFVLIGVNWNGFKGSVYGLLPPPAAEDLPPWRTDYEAALAEAQASGKPLLLDFTADWCPPCRVMEREVWPNAQVRTAVAATTIPLRLDVDEASTAPLLQTRKVSSIPTVLFLDSAGNEISRHGRLSAAELLKVLESHQPQRSR
jgi:thioredoxin 1